MRLVIYEEVCPLFLSAFFNGFLIVFNESVGSGMSVGFPYSLIWTSVSRKFASGGASFMPMALPWCCLKYCPLNSIYSNRAFIFEAGSVIV